MDITDLTLIIYAAVMATACAIWIIGNGDRDV